MTEVDAGRFYKPTVFAKPHQHNSNDGYCPFVYHIGNTAFRVYGTQHRDSDSLSCMPHHEHEGTDEDKEVKTILSGFPEPGEYIRQPCGFMASLARPAGSGS